MYVCCTARQWLVLGTHVGSVSQVWKVAVRRNLLHCFSRVFWFPGNLKGQDTTIQWHLQSRVCNLLKGIENCLDAASEFMGKTFQAAQLTHERFLTIDHSCKIFFWYLPNWTSTDLWCVVLYVTYSTTHQRSVEVQFGRYQKYILQEWSMVKNLSCVSCAA